MKRMYFVSFMIIILIGFNTDDSVLLGAGITKQLKLFDNNGNEKTIFKRGEEFEMRFSMTNLTGEDLTYHYTGVPVIFIIQQLDSTFICSSADGLMVAAVFLIKTLRNGETFETKWLAPNTVDTIPRERKIFLPVGNYKAVVEYRLVFDNMALEKTKPVKFKIIN